MNRPVVIVNPLSSGSELAPAFKARGVPAIAVTLNYDEWPEFGSKIRSTDFYNIIPDQPEIESLIREYDPIAIIPGTEEGVVLAEHLTARLMPQFSNDPKKARHRSHKSFMQMALKECGVPSLKTLHTTCEKEAETWINDQALLEQPLIIKPPSSSGSEKVFYIPIRGDWKTAFNRVLTETLISGKQCESVVIQEQAIGIEFAVGTVSMDGKHFLSHLMKYNKSSVGERRTVFDHVEFVQYDEVAHGALFAYTKRVLDSLGIRWGAAHNEVMLTSEGPRLIESSARMIGGPVVEFSRIASGSSQVDKLVEIYVDGKIAKPEYVLKKTVVPVFLKSPEQGMLSNVEVFDAAASLPTLFKKYIWFKNGDLVPQTVDYLTSFGIIALAGERESIFSDYKKIREMESKLVLLS